MWNMKKRQENFQKTDGSSVVMIVNILQHLFDHSNHLQCKNIHGCFDRNELDGTHVETAYGLCTNLRTGSQVPSECQAMGLVW